MTELSGATEVSESPSAPQAVEWTLAGPWSRYWARTFDMMLFSVVLTLLMWLTMPRLFDEASPLDAVPDLLWFVVSLPVVLGMDALVQAWLGATPGKAIVGIRVRMTSGERPSLKTSLRRNLDIYVTGMAAGIPVINFWSYIHCYEVLDSEELVRWDKRLGTRVVNHGYNIYRLLLLGVATALIPAIAGVYGMEAGW